VLFFSKNIFAGPFTFGSSLKIATYNVSADMQLLAIFPVHIRFLQVCVLAEKLLNMSSITFLGYLGKVYSTSIICSLADGFSMPSM
jgi:hypothetical protein